ncbi:hypothetical protein [Burkholderia pseudomultivorans]|uniref:Uncharacterized protein n=1 Tax=Burkholderia pseudomultivorans TaxID=1207504 RepID=A0A6P2M2T0_9BURK|nr:hypothetical protein [Burkholderia pseudomultivorans]MDR8727951.1 hypothetical protein [Burkholderia pseudomultivorans]MDR8734062.1 hypothetical protein [Burkholderia pseudomultivorans]MDR8743712.1 hypothetical protein [Burkholderia pseudomultivorans]MDR8757829.1 hypothetical protein [Burkholderia pseudomultivorans]MDR8779748.1 hypothetical protein [Burkholderia pseudomultivorans]
MSHRLFPNRDGQRRASGNARALPAWRAAPDIRPPDDLDTLLALARESGLLVTLDGQIGREKYQSIAGPVRALQRFAAALCARVDADTRAASRPRHKVRPGWPRQRGRGGAWPVRHRVRARRSACRRHVVPARRAA